MEEDSVMKDETMHISDKPDKVLQLFLQVDIPKLKEMIYGSKLLLGQGSNLKILEKRIVQEVMEGERKEAVESAILLVNDAIIHKGIYEVPMEEKFIEKLIDSSVALFLDSKMDQRVLCEFVKFLTLLRGSSQLLST
jgi:hypothetical protein